MISIIITFFDNQRVLSLCLGEMLPTLNGHDFEVILVDDNPDHPIARPRLAPRWVQVIRSRTNLGYSGACNLGVDAARGEYVVFVDSDIVPTKGWLDELLRTASENPNAGTVGAKILDLSSGRIVAYGATIHNVDTVHPYRGNTADYPLATRNRSFQFLPSGTMLMRRELFNRVAGFDLMFRNAFCDFDLGMKLSKEGFSGIVSASSIVYHRGAVSGTIRHASYADTKALFFKKWGHLVDSDGLAFLKDSCDLLQKQRQLPASFLGVNLSSSLSWIDYLETARHALGVKLSQVYSLPAIERNARHIRLEDKLDWTTCRLKVPIVYFVDLFSSIISNHYWFRGRASADDIVVDKNGNALVVSDLLRTS